MTKEIEQENHQFIMRVKAKNRRINVVFVDKPIDKSKEPFFILETKRLLSFKDREITTTANSYSVETFLIMSDMIEHLMGNAKVNKVLNRYRGVFEKDKPQCHCNF